MANCKKAKIYNEKLDIPREMMSDLSLLLQIVRVVSQARRIPEYNPSSVHPSRSQEGRVPEPEPRMIAFPVRGKQGRGSGARHGRTSLSTRPPHS